MSASTEKRGPLTGVRVLDLSRILAGPTCTQTLGDLGADVVKIERPEVGDDTRHWGPPFVEGRGGPLPQESAYYLCANRNKRSLTVNLAHEEGPKLIRRLAARADVLIENFKVGGLASRGLGYDDLKDELPRLVYCSISGFGQTGPRAEETGYDFLIQAMGGIMSLTGAPEGPPSKVGVGIADVMCGMYATVAILAALRHRDATGEGQHIDLSLFDTQVAWLINGALNYLTSGQEPRRRGNGHPNIVPYQLFESADGHLAVAAGNDAQYARFALAIGRPDLADDPKFRTNVNRVENRDALVPQLEEVLRSRTTVEWVSTLKEANVPCGPVHSVPEALSDPQAVARELRRSVPYPDSNAGSIDLLANPIRYSKTPVTYQAPPTLGQHTEEVLRDWGELDDESIARLRRDQVV